MAFICASVKVTTAVVVFSVAVSFGASVSFFYKKLHPKTKGL
jgi:hypothetical protein